MIEKLNFSPLNDVNFTFRAQLAKLRDQQSSKAVSVLDDAKEKPIDELLGLLEKAKKLGEEAQWYENSLPVFDVVSQAYLQALAVFNFPQEKSESGQGAEGFPNIDSFSRVFLQALAELSISQEGKEYGQDVEIHQEKTAPTTDDVNETPSSPGILEGHSGGEVQGTAQGISAGNSQKLNLINQILQDDSIHTDEWVVKRRRKLVVPPSPSSSPDLKDPQPQNAEKTGSLPLTTLELGQRMFELLKIRLVSGNPVVSRDEFYEVTAANPQNPTDNERQRLTRQATVAAIAELAAQEGYRLDFQPPDHIERRNGISSTYRLVPLQASQEADMTPGGEVATEDTSDAGSVVDAPATSDVKKN